MVIKISCSEDLEVFSLQGGEYIFIDVAKLLLAEQLL
jgi:hypothetical protein